MLHADAETARAAWRCPRAETRSNEPLDDEHAATLRNTERLVGLSDGALTQCPGCYTRDPDAEEALRLHRWFEKGQLHLRAPHPTGVQVDAIDEVSASLAARSRDDLERARRKSETERGR